MNPPAPGEESSPESSFNDETDVYIVNPSLLIRTVLHWTGSPIRTV